ncbi:MAG: hypothetical protein ACQ9MH_22425, partial [Nitrospinales bacterium]
MGVKNETTFNSSAEIWLPYEPDAHYVFAKGATSLNAPFCGVKIALGVVMEEFFFFNKLIAAGCCLPIFFLRCWSRVILPKKTRSKLWSAWIGAAFGALTLLLFAESVLAAPCDIKPATPAIIRHDLTASYCELCGTGYVTIVIANPYEGADMTNMTVGEDLRSSGLTFDS